MKRIIMLILAIMLIAIESKAQKNELHLQAETRIDYNGEFLKSDESNGKMSFNGKYLNVILSGTIGDNFSYAYRQRLNKAHADQSFFDATDWIYLSYAPSSNWQFSAGKQVVAIGGYEYDRAPIDLYFCSEYWNNIACYQFGLSATYATKSGNDKLLFQVCQSPFRANADNMYAYNLMWMGSHKWYQTIWSVNLIEQMPKDYIAYLALGNQFSFGDFRLQLDYMLRASNSDILFKDYSIMGEASYTIADKINIFGRITYDMNNTLGAVNDFCVMPDTELTRLGAGVEFYPLPKNNRAIRLHAAYSHTLGHNGNPNGALQDGQSMFTVGLKWKIDIISIAKKIF
ncbi:MAG: porin [Alistipes sp.]|nr:porin [Alistipes sp.]